MCFRCNELDGEIAKYKKFLLGFSDRQVLSAVEAKIAALEAEKQALHAESEPSAS